MTELQKTSEKDVKFLAGQEGKYLTFSLGKEEYGIGILKVREIIGWNDADHEGAPDSRVYQGSDSSSGKSDPGGGSTT